MKNKLMKIIFLFFLFLSLKAQEISIENDKNSHLYGAWQNTGNENLGLNGLLFINPNYVAYLDEKKGKYIMRKYKYTISKNGKTINIPGGGYFRIQKKWFSDKIILNRTNWIIPFILTYDGIIKREKMTKEKLFSYLDKINLDIEEMKNSPIRNRCVEKISKDDWERILKMSEEQSGKEIKRLRSNTGNIPDNSLPKEIEEYLESKKNKTQNEKDLSNN